MYAALATGVIGTADHFLRSRQWDLTSSVQLFLLCVAQVGGFYALSRSNESRSYLRELQESVHEVASRAAFVPVLAEQQVARCSTSSTLSSLALATLRALKRSQFFPDVSAFSLWARDDRQSEWRMVAALGPTQGSIDSFRQPFIDVETAGAGVVANLAQTGAIAYYQPRAGEARLGKAEWFAANQHSKHAAETLAVFLLTDDSGSPSGSFALTSEKQDALELEANGRYPLQVQLMLEQCTISLVGLALKANELWRDGK
jgi:hypothetical protein